MKPICQNPGGGNKHELTFALLFLLMLIYEIFWEIKMK